MKSFLSHLMVAGSAAVIGLACVSAGVRPEGRRVAQLGGAGLSPTINPMPTLPPDFLKPTIPVIPAPIPMPAPAPAPAPLPAPMPVRG